MAKKKERQVNNASNPELNEIAKAEMEKMANNQSTAQRNNPNSGTAKLEPGPLVTEEQFRVIYSKLPKGLNKLT